MAPQVAASRMTAIHKCLTPRGRAAGTVIEDTEVPLDRVSDERWRVACSPRVTVT
jgi:sarcosine oxidase gamma subunit